VLLTDLPALAARLARVLALDREQCLDEGQSGPGTLWIGRECFEEVAAAVGPASHLDHAALRVHMVVDGVRIRDEVPRVSREHGSFFYCGGDGRMISDPLLILPSMISRSDGKGFGSIQMETPSGGPSSRNRRGPWPPGPIAIDSAMRSGPHSVPGHRSRMSPSVRPRTFKTLPVGSRIRSCLSISRCMGRPWSHQTQKDEVILRGGCLPGVPSSPPQTLDARSKARTRVALEIVMSKA
jgi:hypothetical protein